MKVVDYNKEKIGKRLNELRGSTTLNIWSRDLNTSSGYISEVENGKKAPSVQMLFSLVNMGYNVDWILTGEGEKLREEKLRELIYAPQLRVVEAPSLSKRHVDPEDYVPLPLLKDHIAAGPPSLIDENDVEEHPALIYASWCPDPGRMVCIRVRGDSMQPTLSDGDIVAVNHASIDPRRLLGKVVAIRENGGATVKRLRYSAKNDLFIGMPDNPDNTDQVLMRPDQVQEQIIGKIEWWWKRQK